MLLLLPPVAAAQTVLKQRVDASSGAVPSPHPRTHVLDYVESSTGLGNPKWETGQSELEMGDVNGDGNVDIVTIGDHGSPWYEHGIMVYFGDGQGTWSVGMNGDFGYGGVALGDVNNDGFVDVGYGMHHNYSSNDFGDQLLEVALGDGTGMNWAPWDDNLATNGETWGMFGTDFADFDCDGYLDIASNAFGPYAGFHAYRNNGDGTWTPTFGLLGGTSNFGICFGDVNNDGYADFAVEHAYGTIYLGDGNGGFTNADSNMPGMGSLGDGVALGDVNGDGCDDVAWVGYPNTPRVWLWSPAGTWVQAVDGLPASGTAEAAQLADMNGDGHVDLVLFGEGTVEVYAGNGQGQWKPAASFDMPASPGRCYAFRAGVDADRNGYPDIVLLSLEGSWPSDYNHLRFFKESSVPDALRVRLTRPAAHRVWRRGSARFVEWCSAVPGGAASAIRIELSTTGPGGPWTLIADNLPDNGRHQMIVPPSLPPSTNCRMRITLSSGGSSFVHVSRGSFEIR
jgi:hypothetical protein